MMRFARQPRRCDARPGQEGVALVEVLISILIFSFGVLGLLALEARAITFSSDAEDRNRAALIANEIASTMWLQNSVTLSAAAYAAFQAKVADPTQGGLPNGALPLPVPVAGTTNSVDITLTWTPPQHGNDSEQSSKLTTRVTLP